MVNHWVRKMILIKDNNLSSYFIFHYIFFKVINFTICVIDLL